MPPPVSAYSYIFYYQSLFVKPSLNAETMAALGTRKNCTEAYLNDHSPFLDAEIPAVMITAITFFHSPYHHQPLDTLETLDIDFTRKKMCKWRLKL